MWSLVWDILRPGLQYFQHCHPLALQYSTLQPSGRPSQLLIVSHPFRKIGDERVIKGVFLRPQRQEQPSVLWRRNLPSPGAGPSGPRLPHVVLRQRRWLCRSPVQIPAAVPHLGAAGVQDGSRACLFWCSFILNLLSLCANVCFESGEGYFLTKSLSICAKCSS